MRWYIGQHVSCLMYGNGIITYIENRSYIYEHTDFKPLHIKFDTCNELMLYTKSGKAHEKYNRTLYALPNDTAIVAMLCNGVYVCTNMRVYHPLYSTYCIVCDNPEKSYVNKSNIIVNTSECYPIQCGYDMHKNVVQLYDTIYINNNIATTELHVNGDEYIIFAKQHLSTILDDLAECTTQNNGVYSRVYWLI